MFGRFNLCPILFKGKKMNYIKLISYGIIYCWFATTFILVANASAGYLLTNNIWINLWYYIISMVTSAVFISLAIKDAWDDKK